MTISGKYELLLPLGVDGFRSFHARHLITGQAVMVHFLEAGQRYEPGPPGAGVPARTIDARSQILDAGISDGTQYLVTYPVADFTSLRVWLDSVAPAPRHVASSPAPPSAATTPLTAPRRGGDELQATSIRPAYVSPAPAKSPPAAPGEFTQLFGGGAGATAKPPGSADGPSVKPAPIVFQDVSPRPPTNPGRDSGSFTARFGGVAPQPAPMRPAPTPAPGPAPSGVGEFTSMFETPQGRPMAGPFQGTRDSSEARIFFKPPAVATPPAAPAPATPSGPGEFTAMFQNQGMPPPAATAPPMAPLVPERSLGGRDHEFSRAFRIDDRGGLPPAPSELARPGQAPKPATAAPAGEFTMMFSGGSNGSAAAPPPPGRFEPAQPAASAAPAAAGHSAFEGATQVFAAPLPQSAAPARMPYAPVGPSEFTMVQQGGASTQHYGPPSSPLAPSPAAAGGLPGLSVQAPAFHKPQLSMPAVSAPHVTGPSVSGAGITAPAVQAPQLSAPSVSAPSMSAPSLNAQVPVAGGAGRSATTSAGIPPLLIALLSCLATIAVLAIVYVLLKR